MLPHIPSSQPEHANQSQYPSNVTLSTGNQHCPSQAQQFLSALDTNHSSMMPARTQMDPVPNLTAHFSPAYVAGPPAVSSSPNPTLSPFQQHSLFASHLANTYQPPVGGFGGMDDGRGTAPAADGLGLSAALPGVEQKAATVPSQQQQRPQRVTYNPHHVNKPISITELIETDDVKEIESLLQKGRVSERLLLQRVNKQGDKYFHLSAMKGSVNCLNFLIQLGVDVNELGKNGRTALFLAAR